MIKVLHTGDIHYCPKHIEGVDRCFAFAVEKAIEQKCDVAVLNGDIFDHRIDLHSPVVAAVLRRVATLADAMPVLVGQGTFSHDVPGSLDVFKTIRGRYPVFIADRICQVALADHGDEVVWVPSGTWSFMPSEIERIPCRALFSCLPSINKGAVAALVGAENASEAVGEQVYNLLKGWAPANLAARQNGVPTIGVSHGTCSGCTTEQGVVMAGLDHEYSSGALFAAECSAFMLNHIHQTQQWDHNGRCAAYSGSLERLHFGEVNPKGFLIWDVHPDRALPRFIETPAKKLLQIDFEGQPNMDELAALAAQATGAHVRVRYSIDEEHRHAVDKDAITALFATATELKIEGRINPIQRTRSEGMNRAPTLGEKLAKWCEVTTTEARPLQERLATLEHADPEKIVANILNEKQEPQERAA